MSDDELKKMYDEAVRGYAYWEKGFYPKSVFKKVYTEIAKILKKRGVVVESVAINESDWGTYDTPEGKMVAKELEKAWTTFAKTVDAAHKDWLKTVQKYRGEAGKGSGFRDSEGRDAVVSAMEWYLEKVFMADRRFGGIDYKKYRTLMGESVEVDEAIELFSLYTPIEFAQEWAAAYGEDLQQEYSGLYKELLKLKRFTVLDITRLWKKLYGEDFKKEYSALYKKLDK